MNDVFRDVLGRMLGRRPAVLQVGAVCVRPSDGRILLITSRGTGRWIIPKGWPMTGRSAAAAAMQEAWEEAGVRGSVSARPLGRYRYNKRHDGMLSVPIDVQVHRVQVDRLEDDFPEAAERERSWFSPREAAGHVSEEELRDILLGLHR